MSVTVMVEWKEERNKLISDHKDLYEGLVRGGLPHPDAITAITHFAKQQDEYMTFTNDIDVQKSIELSLLESNTGWSKMEESDKKLTLYKLGMDVYNVGYRTFFKVEREGCNLKIVKSITSGERLDPKWINYRNEKFEHYASDEARDLVFLRKQLGKENIQEGSVTSDLMR